MIRPLLVFAPLALCIAVAAQPMGAPTERVGQDDALQDRRPEVKEKLDELASLIKGRGERDAEAVAAIDQLLQEFPRSGPRDRGAIVDGLSRCFEQRRQELEGGTPNNALFLAAAVALGEMGAEASGDLVKWIGEKRHRSDLVLQRRLILSLGKTKDPKRTRDLVGLLQSKDAILVAATAEAMANFADADGKLRKDLFSELLKVLMSTKGRMDTDSSDLEARQRYDAIAAPIVTTMQALTGHEERVPEEWQRWWNKNKKADWEREQGT
jgi:hypothetical protein